MPRGFLVKRYLDSLTTTTTSSSTSSTNSATSQPNVSGSGPRTTSISGEEAAILGLRPNSIIRHGSSLTAQHCQPLIHHVTHGASQGGPPSRIRKTSDEDLSSDSDHSDSLWPTRGLVDRGPNSFAHTLQNHHQRMFPSLYTLSEVAEQQEVPLALVKAKNSELDPNGDLCLPLDLTCSSLRSRSAGSTAPRSDGSDSGNGDHNSGTTSGKESTDISDNSTTRRTSRTAKMPIPNPKSSPTTKPKRKPSTRKSKLAKQSNKSTSKSSKPSNKSVRKTKKLDEFKSSPVSGTIILLDPTDSDSDLDAMDSELRALCVHRAGDIDPAYNTVSITEEAREELSKVVNIIGDYLCVLCKDKFVDAFELARHRCPRIVHLEYRCPQCEKVFSCPANLASHRRWHKPRDSSEAASNGTKSKSKK